jgi:hypothetical protein
LKHFICDFLKHEVVHALVHSETLNCQKAMCFIFLKFLSPVAHETGFAPGLSL